MHEFSLCHDLLNQVMTIAAQNKAQSVDSITVQMGALSGVEPALLENAFSLVKLGTIAEEAVLILQETPVTVLCRHCEAESEASANNLQCKACRSHETILLSGNELLLASVALNCA